MRVCEVFCKAGWLPSPNALPAPLLAVLAGILVEVLVGSPSTVREEQASLFQGLLLLSRLASLQLDRLETTARVPPAVYPKHAQHFAPALSLTGRLAELLPASTYGGSLTSLSIHGHHLLESDVSCFSALPLF